MNLSLSSRDYEHILTWAEIICYRHNWTKRDRNIYIKLLELKRLSYIENNRRSMVNKFKRKFQHKEKKGTDYAEILAKKAKLKKGTPEGEELARLADLAAKGLSLEPKGLYAFRDVKLGGRKHIILNPKTVDEEKRKKYQNSQK